MTNTHKLLTLALGAMILFAACGREDDKPTTPTDPVPDGEKKLECWEWLNYYTVGTSTWGAFFYYKFSWDNGLLKKMERFFNDDGQSEYSREIIYENGKAKEIREYYAPGELHCAYTLLYTGDRVTGAVRSNGGEVTNSYNAAGELVKQTLTYNDGGTYTTYLTWENGNVVEIRAVDNYDSRTSTYSYTYTYDNKINPLRSVMSTLVYASLSASGWRLSKNNVISETWIDNDGEQSVPHSTYTYGGDYPTSMTQEWTGDNWSGKDRSYFRYTDGSGMSISSQVCRIRIETGSEGRPYNADGDGEYLKGDTVIISADPEYDNGGTHYTFSRWSDGNTDNPRTFVATADMTFQPVYVPAGE